MAEKQYVWLDGKFIDFGNAKVSILTHSLQYGSGVFEGIRAYNTKKGTAIFRLHEHFRRFVNSAKIYSMKMDYDQKFLEKAAIELVRKNKLQSCYIRPFSFYNDMRIGLNTTGKKVSTAIMAVPLGNYFEGKEKGISCKVSSWRRISSETLPPHAKGSGNYMNSILASQEAKENGATEAIMLGLDGYVAEGPGENIFLVSDNKLVTPSESSDILLGITRDSIIKIAENLGVIVEEREVHREELYTSDELFFSGTAAELTPITKVDGRKVGNGEVGPITKLLSQHFTEVVTGADAEFEHWLTYI